jgi:8-amino-7-oxononanoate synthase
LQEIKLLGSTGSRLLTGDSQYAQTLEKRLAKWHRRQAALLCNSGYDANLSALSCLTMDTVVIMDELSHNSLQMGVKLSKNCDVAFFLHNDMKDLRRLLEHYHCNEATRRKPILVVVESVYSMDGDVAPLKDVLDLSLEYRACVIVDEAHGMGVFGEHGMGVLEQCDLENHPALLCSIHTFGKAAGCHGAVICGSQSIRDFLLNYGRPIIYSTSLPTHSLVTIACSYQTMAGPEGRDLRYKVNERVEMFRRHMNDLMKQTRGGIGMTDSISPIQALIVPSNSACVEFCDKVWEKSLRRIRLYPIRSPTVPKGQERVRIIVHAHNTPSQVTLLLQVLRQTMLDMGYLTSSHSRL